MRNRDVVFRYSVMKTCWNAKADLRPSFSDLVSTLSQILESLTGYFDLSVFNKTPSSPCHLDGHESAADKLENTEGDLSSESPKAIPSSPVSQPVTTCTVPSSSGAGDTPDPQNPAPVLSSQTSCIDLQLITSHPTRPNHIARMSSCLYVYATTDVPPTPPTRATLIFTTPILEENS